MACFNGGVIRNKNQTEQRPTQWTIRVARPVVANQPSLSEPIEALRAYSGDIVKYKKSLGQMAMTLLTLEPLLYKLTSTPFNQGLDHGMLNEVAVTINELCDKSQKTECQVPPFKTPLRVFGQQDKYLGIQLINRDGLQIYDDRELIYRALGQVFSLEPMRVRKMHPKHQPHITIGSIQWNNIDYSHRDDFAENPGAYLESVAQYQREIAIMEHRLPLIPIPVIQRKIALSGLSVACVPK